MPELCNDCSAALGKLNAIGLDHRENVCYSANTEGYENPPLSHGRVALGALVDADHSGKEAHTKRRTPLTEVCSAGGRFWQ